MIRYDLTCEDGHAFDGWFGNSAAFDDQTAAGAVSCPRCGSAKIAKQLMTPGIGSKANRRAAGTPATFSSIPNDAQAIALHKAIRELRRYVKEKAEYVGDRFAEEARRMHYSEVKERCIYGEATADETRDLLAEGIEVRPLPSLPEDHN
ncbi:MAG: DUF1178 family protein [Pseudomonadota bacterium]|nr:DUF1178 family protein [Pseudomonadota bacterium]